jgi:hypothetical protein
LFNPIGPELLANADRYVRTVVFQKALATLPRRAIEEGAISRDILLSELSKE